MLEFTSINHKIQKHIIDQLTYTETLRFSDLRPVRTDTNLFTYHLNTLVKANIVLKVKEGYTLSALGQSYVDRVDSEKKTFRTQPKVIVMFLIQNSDGDILLQRRAKQPHINTWTLPYGKVRINDESLQLAAKREASQKLGLVGQDAAHIGDCYIRVKGEEGVLSTTLAHVFAFNRDNIETTDDIVWARPHRLRDFRLAPAVEAIVARGFFHDPFFFEEFESDWYNEPYES